MSKEKFEHKEECNCGHEHQQVEECGCGHEHQHGEDCGCGDGHGHGEECGCGHEHSHEEACGCGHDHQQADNDKKEVEWERSADANVEQKIYLLEHLSCANCAAKMEIRIRELPEVVGATITFATKQLRVKANHQEQLLPVLQGICSSIESEVVVIPRESYRAKAEEKVTEKKLSDNTKSVIGIAAGAILFISGNIVKNTNVTVSDLLFILSYIILGGRIVWAAVKNLTKGHVFDENFLMSVATLAAFAIGDFAEAVGVMLFYRVGEVFEHIAVERSRNQIMSAVDMRPEVVNLVKTGNDVEVIPAEQAGIGDILLVRPGDRIPLDGIVTDGESRIDTSPITGEPVPVGVKAGMEVISGCVNTSGVLKIRVEKELGDSMVTRIMDSVENAAASKPKIDRFITRFARVYTPFVVLLAIGTAIIPSLITGNWNHWIYTAITFLVISCPCALVLSVPLAFFSGIGAGSKKGILFKGGVALEALKEIKAVVMDKTGTITEGNFVLQSCVPAAGIKEEELLRMAAECEMNSTHPIGNSIIVAAKEKGIVITRPQEVKEISGKGILATLANGTVLCGNRALLEAFGVDLSAYQKTQYGTEVLLALDGSYIGYLVIADTIKQDAVSAVSALKSQRIITAMLTGDAKDSSDAIAKETGIDEVHAQLLPDDKLRHLKDIRARHGAVMFVGDGINDAPVLAGADVGAAMGSGADAAIEAADVVFMTSAMDAIPQSLRIAKATARIAMQNVVFALAIKVLVMVLGLLGFANMWMAVFADTGVAMICVVNAIRILYKK